MPGFDVWDLVKVPFPYTDRATRQRRPALVVAVPRTEAPGLLWVVMVTSAANRGWPGDVVVSDLAVAGLPAPSVVRPVKIATIEVGAAERIGTLPSGGRGRVAEALGETLGVALLG